MIHTQTVIEFWLLKWIKLSFILIYLLISYQYYHNTQDYDCYQMEYDMKYHLKHIFTLDTQWTFYGMSMMEPLIDTQQAIVLQSLKWIKLLYILSYLFMSPQYHHNKQDYDCCQIKYDIEYHFNYAIVLGKKCISCGISITAVLIHTQTVIELLLL